MNADGLVVADVTALRNRRTVAAGVDIAYRPAVSRDGKVVLSSGTRVFAFGLSDGGQYWATSARFADMTRGGAPVVVGDRALLVDG
ncbi:hypothetical protein [Streptomyces sp. NPDC057545]|uniref:hypothetical protein n=1 Tax=Streptomyces sp. NPDC057545 TaxID=3346164 RepID=UPI0036B7F59F